MDTKNEVKVFINGKDYTISGVESEEYLQKIAIFLNSKYDEISKQGGYSHLSLNMKNILMQINLADEYYKILEEKENLEKQLFDKDKEIFELKNKLSSGSSEKGKKGKQGNK